MKKLLYVGDAACPTGFARASHGVLDTLHKHYDTSILAINYRGDPHSYPYDIYAAAAGGDFMGVGRLVWMCDKTKPDVIVVQNDGWNIPQYVRQLRLKKPDGSYYFPEHANLPIVAIVPIDGKNFRGPWLDGISMAVFWTKFALDEARLGGYHGPATVIPLGVDLELFKPMEKSVARFERGLSTMLPNDAFIVGCVNRNQPRKRWDLLIKYFSAWVHQYSITNAFLYLHIAPTGDEGIKVDQLASYYDIWPYLIMREPPMWYGDDDAVMALTYNCFDVAATTTAGEGFGLTSLEAMACRVASIVPDWAALGDWAKRGAWVVPCTSTHIGAPYVNVIGGVPDEKSFILALQRLYKDRRALEQNSQAALECAQQPQFRWANIGERYLQTLEDVLANNVAQYEPKSAEVITPITVTREVVIHEVARS